MKYKMEPKVSVLIGLTEDNEIRIINSSYANLDYVFIIKEVRRMMCCSPSMKNICLAYMRRVQGGKRHLNLYERLILAVCNLSASTCCTRVCYKIKDKVLRQWLH